MTLTNEIWKVISHHKWYEVSNKGRVKSNKFNKERILKAGTNSSGYNFVVLEGTSYLVHRLVAEAFISNPYNLPIINHIDKNINNNCVENLEWCDVRYNNLYSGCKERLREQATHPVVRIGRNACQSAGRAASVPCHFAPMSSANRVRCGIPTARRGCPTAYVDGTWLAKCQWLQASPSHQLCVSCLDHA
jgi:hypothetical protein